MTTEERSEMMRKQWADGKRKTTIPRTLPDKTCPNCGNIFRPKHSKNVCCSHKCSNRKGKFVKCEQCGKEIWKKPYNLKAKKSFCSKECADKGHSKFMRKKFPGGSGNPFYRSGRRYEYKVVRELLSDGFTFAMRSPGSKGVFDVWGIKITPTDLLLKLIQVKGMKNTKTFNRAIPRVERSIMFKSIVGDNFKWWGKIRGIPKWASIVNFEIWVYNKGKECHKFRLIFKEKAREPEVIKVVNK